MTCLEAYGNIIIHGTGYFDNLNSGGSVITTTGVMLPNGNSLLDYYENKTSNSVTYSGALSGSTNIIATRIGSLCTIHIPKISGASTGTTNIVISSLPSKFIPGLNPIEFQYIALSNSIRLIAALKIDNLGNITLYGDINGGNFSPLGNCGMDANIELSYLI